MCSGAQAAEGRVCKCGPSAPAAGGEVCRCEPSGPGPEGASGAAPRGLCRGRQGSARRDGAQQPARWGHIVPTQADRPGRRGPGARRHGARGARVRAGREGSRASSRQREIGRGARAAAAPRAPATRGHGADTGRPTRAAMGRHRPGAGTATNRPRRTGRKQGRATISAEPGRSSWPPSAPTRSRVAPWRATRRRHGGSAPRPPPANRARTASPGRRASRAIAAQANTRTGTAKRSGAKGGALPKERAGRRGGS